MPNTPEAMAAIEEMTRRIAPVITFLKDRLAEDEMAARCIHRGEQRWRADGRRVTIDGRTDSPDIATAETDQIAAYVVRFSPERIEAEIKAKRRIINSLENQIEGASRNDSPLAMLALNLLPAVALAVHLASSAYVHHPDYDQSWGQ